MRWRKDTESVGKCISKSRYVKDKYHYSPSKYYKILDKLLEMLLRLSFSLSPTFFLIQEFETSLSLSLSLSQVHLSLSFSNCFSFCQSKIR